MDDVRIDKATLQAISDAFEAIGNFIQEDGDVRKSEVAYAIDTAIDQLRIAMHGGQTITLFVDGTEAMTAYFSGGKILDDGARARCNTDDGMDIYSTVEAAIEAGEKQAVLSYRKIPQVVTWKFAYRHGLQPSTNGRLI